MDLRSSAVVSETASLAMPTPGTIYGRVPPNVACETYLREMRVPFGEINSVGLSARAAQVATRTSGATLSSPLCVMAFWFGAKVPCSFLC